jgi:hypothetical protein
MFLKTLISRQGERVRLVYEIEYYEYKRTDEWRKGGAADWAVIDVITGIIVQLREELKLRDSGVWYHVF